MADLPHPWPMYAALQADLATTNRLSGKTWGTEAALDHFLDAIMKGTPATTDEIVRAAASRRRRERDRTRLRTEYMLKPDVSPHPDEQLISRSELRAAHSRLPPKAWALLSRIAVGFEYADVATATGEAPGSLRLQALRARKLLAA